MSKSRQKRVATMKRDEQPQRPTKGAMVARALQKMPRRRAGLVLHPEFTVLPDMSDKEMALLEADERIEIAPAKDHPTAQKNQAVTDAKVQAVKEKQERLDGVMPGSKQPRRESVSDAEV